MSAREQFVNTSCSDCQTRLLLWYYERYSFIDTRISVTVYPLIFKNNTLTVTSTSFFIYTYTSPKNIRFMYTALHNNNNPLQCCYCGHEYYRSFIKSKQIRMMLPEDIVVFEENLDISNCIFLRSKSDIF